MPPRPLLQSHRQELWHSSNFASKSMATTGREMLSWTSSSRSRTPPRLLGPSHEAGCTPGHKCRTYRTPGRPNLNTTILCCICQLPRCSLGACRQPRTMLACLLQGLLQSLVLFVPCSISTLDSRLSTPATTSVYVVYIYCRPTTLTRLACDGTYYLPGHVQKYIPQI